jgi:putative alpha-1,2-mannosidase
LKKTMTWDMTREKSEMRSKSENLIIIWSIISTVSHLLIWSQLKTADSSSSSTYENILIETMSRWNSWLERTEIESVRNSLMRKFFQCLIDCELSLKLREQWSVIEYL